MLWASACARKGVWALARGYVRVRHCVRADAFGNALGSSVVAGLSRPSQQEDVLGDFIEQQLAAQKQRENPVAVSTPVRGPGNIEVRELPPLEPNDINGMDLPEGYALQGPGSTSDRARGERILAQMRDADPNSQAAAERAALARARANNPDQDARDIRLGFGYQGMMSRQLSNIGSGMYSGAIVDSPLQQSFASPDANFAHGFSGEGDYWSVLKGKKPLAYSMGSMARTGLNIVYDSLTGAGAFRQAGQEWDNGNHMRSVIHGMEGVGTAGLTVLSLGEFAAMKMAATGVTKVEGVSTGAIEYVTMYRGDRAGKTEILSYAAKEGGLAHSQRLIDEGNLDDLFKAHAKDSSKPMSPFISVTSDRRVAEHFAGRNGVVYELRIPVDRVTFNRFNDQWVTGNGKWISESEYLVPNQILPSEFVR